MPRYRVLVPYPAEVIAEIDKIVAHGKRTAFLVELAKRELKRRRLLELFERTEPIWKPEDHPEIDDAGPTSSFSLCVESLASGSC
jgi:hypothetical protein